MQRPRPPIEYYTAAEAASRVGVHPRTLRRWIDNGILTCARTPGGHRRYRVADITLLLERMASGEWKPAGPPKQKS